MPNLVLCINILDTLKLSSQDTDLLDVDVTQRISSEVWLSPTILGPLTTFYSCDSVR
jgi:hypothetical protein